MIPDSAVRYSEIVYWDCLICQLPTCSIVNPVFSSQLIWYSNTFITVGYTHVTQSIAITPKHSHTTAMFVSRWITVHSCQLKWKSGIQRSGNQLGRQQDQEALAHIILNLYCLWQKCWSGHPDDVLFLALLARSAVLVCFCPHWQVPLWRN